MASLTRTDQSRGPGREIRPREDRSWSPEWELQAAQDRGTVQAPTGPRWSPQETLCAPTSLTAYNFSNLSGLTGSSTHEVQSNFPVTLHWHTEKVSLMLHGHPPP